MSDAEAEGEAEAPDDGDADAAEDGDSVVLELGDAPLVILIERDNDTENVLCAVLDAVNEDVSERVPENERDGVAEGEGATASCRCLVSPCSSSDSDAV